MTGNACENCPFRDGSLMSYDADAMAALADGDEPACHAVVGLDSIFVHSPFTPEDAIACLGFRFWLKRKKGFRRPKHGVTT
jgi:hypothetical protein